MSKTKIYCLISTFLALTLMASPLVPLLDRELVKMLVLGAAEEENHSSKEGPSKQLDKNKLLHKFPSQIDGDFFDQIIGRSLHAYQFSVSEHQMETVDPPPEPGC